MRGKQPPGTGARLAVASGEADGVYEVALVGGMASGKSTVARELERLGATRVDLDAVSREVLAPDTPCEREVRAAFGDAVVDPKTGELSRRLLAEHAFADHGRADRLEAIELPHIERTLRRRLADLEGRPGVVVVEVPLPDRVPGLLQDLDEVVAVVCPLGLRRERARGRGVAPDDFDARVARQTTDEWLVAHAATVFDNTGDERALLAQADAWWELRMRQGAFRAAGGGAR